MSITSYFVTTVGSGRMAEGASGTPVSGSWMLPGYNDSLWTVPVLRTTASGDSFHFPTPIVGGPPGSGALVLQDSPQTTHFPRYDGYRFVFPMPAFNYVSSATLLLNVIQDPLLPGANVWINGNQIATNTGPSGSSPLSITVPTMVFVPGDNLVAVQNEWSVAYNGGMAFGLTIVSSLLPPDYGQIPPFALGPCFRPITVLRCPGPNRY